MALWSDPPRRGRGLWSTASIRRRTGLLLLRVGCRRLAGSLTRHGRHRRQAGLCGCRWALSQPHQQSGSASRSSAEARAPSVDSLPQSASDADMVRRFHGFLSRARSWFTARPALAKILLVLLLIGLLPWLLIAAGLMVTAIGVVGLRRGSLPAFRLTGRSAAAGAVLVGLATVCAGSGLAASVLNSGSSPARTKPPIAAPTTSSAPPTTPAPTRPPPPRPNHRRRDQQPRLPRESRQNTTTCAGAASPDTPGRHLAHGHDRQPAAGRARKRCHRHRPDRAESELLHRGRVQVRAIHRQRPRSEDRSSHRYCRVELARREPHHPRILAGHGDLQPRRTNRHRPTRPHRARHRQTRLTHHAVQRPVGCGTGAGRATGPPTADRPRSRLRPPSCGAATAPVTATDRRVLPNHSSR